MDKNYKQNLVSARNTSRLAKNPTPPRIARRAKKINNTLGLMKHLNPFLDWLFGIALTLALLKDILDFVGVGSFPAIGTAVTLCVSFIIGLVMFIVSSGNQKMVVKKTMKKFGVLGGGTLVEMIFGINFLPVETLTVIIIFYLTLKERAQADQEQKITQSQQIGYADDYSSYQQKVA